MSIDSYDVEPIDSRSFTRWMLGLVGAFFGVLAIIGWPLPIASGRYEHGNTWAQGLALINDWLTHAGWRMSGSSWLWGGLAVGATTRALQAGGRGGSIRPTASLWSLIPGALIAGVGPIVQFIAGVRWSNYSSSRTTVVTVIVYAACLVMAVTLPALGWWLTRRSPGTEDSSWTPGSR